jgi:peptide/nickel transport system substrate-binding protein
MKRRSLTRLRRTHRTLTLVAALVAAALPLSACGSAKHVSAPGKTILKVESVPTGPVTRNFNPFGSQSTVNLLGGRSMINEPLYLTSELRTGDVKPWLAKDHQFSADGMSMTLTLQTGVKWSDGQAFSADDVAFTFNMLQKFPGLNTTGIPIKDAKATGPDQVTLDFAFPGYTAASDIGHVPIVAQHQWSSVADPVAYTDDDPIGTGPFMLDGASFSPQGYTLVKNPNYWQAGLPKIDGLQYVAFDSNTSANLALENGDLDWTGNFVPNIETAYVAKDKAHNHYWFPPARATFLCLNQTLAKYQDVALRRAVSQVLDRAALVKAGEQDEQPAATTPTGLILPNQKQFLAPDYQNLTLAPDATAAKATLTAAGYTFGSDGTLMGKDGKPVTLTLSAPTAFTDIQAMYQVAVQELASIGIKADIKGGDTNTWIGTLLTGNYDATICARLAQEDPDPYATYFGNLSSALSKPVGQPSFGNFEHWNDKATDALLAQYMATTDATVRQQALNGLQKIMVEQVPVIPLFYNVDWAEYSTKKVTGWPSADDPYATAGPVSSTSGWVALHLVPVGK